jgi:hypothetical protein
MAAKPGDQVGMRAKLRYRVATLAVAAGVCVALLSVVVLRVNTYFNTSVDQDFVADYSFDNCKIGVALRLPRAGILGKGRYYVIIVVDNEGRLVETLYEGPGAYPDAPEKPVFVRADGARVTYDTPEAGRRTFVVGREDLAPTTPAK